MGDLEILRIVTNVANELTIGEMRQLAAVESLSFSEEDYYRLIRAKTASLIAGACESGALCGAAEFRTPLAQFGDRLGMAFQIADDILDYTEDESVTGKPSGLDLREHKVTLPLIAAPPNLNAVERERIETLFGRSPDDGLVSIQLPLSKGGGLEYARRQGERFAGEAEAALRGLPRPGSGCPDRLDRVRHGTAVLACTA
jgi:octaprenyl-diphosphate synthase